MGKKARKKQKRAPSPKRPIDELDVYQESDSGEDNGLKEDVSDLPSDFDDEDIPDDEAFAEDIQAKMARLRSDSDDTTEGSEGDDEEEAGGMLLSEIVDAGDSSEGESDGERHKRLIETVTGKSARNKAGKRSTGASEALGDSNLANEFGAGTDLALSDLVRTLQDTAGFGKLKKQLSELGGGAALSTPVPRIIAERANREEAYAHTKKDLSKWKETVQRNRRAKHLAFPLNEEAPHKTTTAELVAKFDPRTKLEAAVTGLLTESGMTEAEACKGEVLEMNELSVEEVKERQAKLAKMKALLSYEEARARRRKKIKSKSYHKILKKERVRQKETAYDLLKETDPEAAEEERLKREKNLARERMSLRHKNTSKWARRMLTHGNAQDTGTRQAIQEQIRLGEELRKKIQGGSGSDGSDGSDSDSGNSTPDGDVQGEGDDNQSETRPKGLFGLKFMQRGQEKEKLDLQGLLAGDSEGSDTDAESSEGSGTEAKEGLPAPKEGVAGRRKFGSAEAKGKQAGSRSKPTAAQSGKANDANESTWTLGALADGMSSEGSDGGSGSDSSSHSGDEKPLGGNGDRGALAVKQGARGKGKGRVKAPVEPDSEQAGTTKTSSLSVSRGITIKTTGDGSLDVEPHFKRRGAEATESTTAAVSSTAALAKEAGPDSGSCSGGSNGDPDEGTDGAGNGLDDDDALDEDALDPCVLTATKALLEAPRSKQASVPAPPSRKRRAPVQHPAAEAVVSEAAPTKKQRTAKKQTAAPAEPAQAQAARKSKAGKRSRAAAELDDDGHVAEGVVAAVNGVHGDAGSDSGSDGVVDGADAARQRELVRQAFAGDDVEAEFLREKEMEVDAGLPPDDVAVLPGWGAWGGSGIKPSTKLPKFAEEAKRKRALEVEAVKKARRDKDLTKVVICERKNKKTAKYSVPSIPHPYTSREHFERAMRHPVGKEWNTGKVHQSLIKPAIKLKRGAVIDPIQLSKGPRKVETKKTQRKFKG